VSYRKQEFIFPRRAARRARRKSASKPSRPHFPSFSTIVVPPAAAYVTVSVSCPELPELS